MKQHTVPYDRIDEQKRVHHGNVVHSFRLYEKGEQTGKRAKLKAPAFADAFLDEDERT